MTYHPSFFIPDRLSDDVGNATDKLSEYLSAKLGMEKDDADETAFDLVCSYAVSKDATPDEKPIIACIEILIDKGVSVADVIEIISTDYNHSVPPYVFDELTDADINDEYPDYFDCLYHCADWDDYLTEWLYFKHDDE